MRARRHVAPGCLAPVLIDTDTPGAAMSWRPEIACSGTNLIVVWEDSRSGVSAVRWSISRDDGATWLLADEGLEPGPPGCRCFSPGVTLDGARARFAYEFVGIGPS